MAPTTSRGTVSGGIRVNLWRRALIGLAAAVLYVVGALILAAVLPESAWPHLGGDGYTAGQVSTVPAMNLFGAGVILVSVFEPLLPSALRHPASAVIALAAALAAPFMALVEGTVVRSEWATPGVLALGLLGLILGALRVVVTARSASGTKTVPEADR